MVGTNVKVLLDVILVLPNVNGTVKCEKKKKIKGTTKDDKRSVKCMVVEIAIWIVGSHDITIPPHQNV